MTPRLPQLLVALLMRVVPLRDRAQVLAELDDDYRRVRTSSSPWAAALWLGRESASLAWAFTCHAVAAARGWGPAWSRDSRLVVRGLRRAPLATLGAAATLAAGFLAVLVTTGLAGTLLFRPVSDVHGEALRRVAAVDVGGRASYRLSFVELELVRQHLVDSAVLGAANLQPVVLRADRTDLQTMIEVVDAGYFGLVGAPMVAGRGLVSSDDRSTAPPVVVIGEALWRRQYGADPLIVGRTVELNHTTFTIVGVTAASGAASALGAGVDAWAPLAHGDALLSAGWRTDPGARWFAVFALPTTSTAEVDARLSIAAAELARRHPDAWRGRLLRTDPGARLTGGQRANVTTLAWILAGLSTLILAVGAANVGGLLLARAAAAERHTAIHLSMGAGRTAIVRRLLFEGALLGWIGGVLAVGAYVWARRMFAEIALLPTLALRLDLPLDSARVIAVVLLSGLVGATLAAGPAIWSVRGGHAAVLGGGHARAIGGRGASRARRILVSTQICVSLTLVVAAALFARTLGALETMDVGFAKRGLVAMDFDLEPAVPPGQAAVLARAALERASRVPGVSAAAMSNRAPVDGSTPLVEVRSDRAGVVVGDVTIYLATPRYFETVAVGLLAGRAFTAEECDREADVVIVNESLARRLWVDGDPLGRSLAVGPDQRVVRVVGVARNSKYRSIAESGQLHVYRPTPPAFHLTLLARTAGDPRGTLRALQQALERDGPGVVGFFPRTLDEHLAIELLPTRAAARAAAGLGTLSLVLSTVGLYGLVSWFVERRRREIGVRVAIGARPVDIVRLVVSQTAAAAAPGLAAGVGLAALLGVVARTALHGVGPLDPAAFAAGAAALSAVVGAAAWLPSWRASRVDPTVALRDL